ncbi:MAG: hypothetical protein CO108_10790 [Deltaproteobacteria bacterium CG_4_9_14_3_um_filter_63_12]|nr:MAG: hypothetical protein COW42_08505 [Deltaproteobacteria bacterium CG17_big_fil_post_rev_8_21_14_2_50_63_7]PJB43001.1 MAG: hypothetical protein CO108_10790 [Deltaproteobacteria bacterium CG_4_9_14_3_um_filter_63_12]
MNRPISRPLRNIVDTLLALALVLAANLSGCASGDGLNNKNDTHQSDVADETSTQTDADEDAVEDVLSDADLALDDQLDGTDDATQVDGDTAPDTSNTCIPNHDGTITRAEMPIQTGLRGTFKVAQDASVDMVGSTDDAGLRSWDLSGALAGDHLVLSELRVPDGFWFANDFPNATYVSPLSDTSPLLGIFQATDGALLLLGVASPEDSFTATKVTYDPGVTLLSFPLTANKTWTTDTSISGTYNGVFTMYNETYVSKVDTSGTLRTPFGEFDVLRVAVTLDKTVGFITTTTRSLLFVTECFGTVANVTSQADETAVEFTDAAEVRRLSP